VSIDYAEVAARQFEVHRSQFDTPGLMARHMDPRTIQTPMLDVVDGVCQDIMTESFVRGRDRGPRKMILTPPQEGKSQRLSRRFPLWALLQNPELRIAIASYEANTARRWGRAIRDDIDTNPELGLRISSQKSAQHEWELFGHGGGVYTVGVGGALTGRSVDLMIIDDPVKGREEADSETYREKVWNWYTDTVVTRLSPGAAVVLIMTRWHPDDLAGRLEAEGGWDITTIPAKCEDPQIDPLGRELGEYLESARGRTPQEWEALRVMSEIRTWSALYQQAPTPPEGLVFHREWIDKSRKTSGEGMNTFVRRLVAIDPAAKSKTTSDETGIVVLALDNRGEAWVLDDRTLRGTPESWGRAAWSALIDWKATEIVVEDNQGGEMITTVLSTAWQEIARNSGIHVTQPKVTTVTADKSKRIRAESVAYLYETGAVHHAHDGTTRLKKLEDQMCTWTGQGSSPDRMDALVHGLRALATPGTSQHQNSTRTR